MTTLLRPPAFAKATAGKRLRRVKMTTMTKMTKYFPALLWLLLITALSTLPNPQLPGFQLLAADKLVHAVVYGVLTWLLLRGWSHSSLRSAGWRERWAAFLFSTAYGVLMEWVQYAFIPGRFYEFDDMLANAAGAAVGAVFLRKKGVT